jgi:hypothetical protein
VRAERLALAAAMKGAAAAIVRPGGAGAGQARRQAKCDFS